jgi:carboxymethylenebutenolidase
MRMERLRLVRTVVALLMTLAISASARAADDAPPPIPPGEKGAKSALNSSPRHGEWVDVAVPGGRAPIKAYIVYPQRKDKAPVVIVVHEIFGLSDWVRGVTDQLAADGFIAIAPDLLSGHGVDGGGTDSLGSRDDVVRAIQKLKPDEVMADLDAARDYAIKQPSANGKSASIGFCWGGGQSFAYAVHQPGLDAAVVFYGVPPSASAMAKIKAPVLGQYGGKDARISSTVDTTAAQMKAAGKSYTSHVYDGAGHGFMRAQDGQNGANLEAARKAWPAALAFLREHLK